VENDNLFLQCSLQNNNKILSLFMSFFILYERIPRSFLLRYQKHKKGITPRGLAASSYIEAAAYSGSLLLLLLAALSGPIRASFSLQIDKLAYSVCMCVCAAVPDSFRRRDQQLIKYSRGILSVPSLKQRFRRLLDEKRVCVTGVNAANAADCC
jgi:hypothetical protein